MKKYLPYMVVYYGYIFRFFAVRNNKLVSYLDLKYDIHMDSLPVEKIIIGSNCKVSKGDIFHLLEFYGFDGNEVEIAKSESSYSI